jgi:hypothetical protein
MIILGLLILGILLFLMKRSAKVHEEGKDEETNLADLNETFLKDVEGRTVIDLVKVFNPSDEMILRSILASENIDSYVKSNHFGDLLGCSQESIFSTAVISVFEDSSGQAKTIVQDYIHNLYKDQRLDEEEQLHQNPPGKDDESGSDIKYIPELLV